jgi:hypothetical protein
MVKITVLGVVGVEVRKHTTNKRRKVVATVVVVVLDDLLALLHSYGFSLRLTLLTSCFLPFFGIGRKGLGSFNLTVFTAMCHPVRGVTFHRAAPGHGFWST